MTGGEEGVREGRGWRGEGDEWRGESEGGGGVERRE